MKNESSIPATSANPRSALSVVAFTNEVEIDPRGWAQLAPFGDYPGQAVVQQSDGSSKKFSAVQRLDKAAAEMMVSRFKSPWQRMKRYFIGCPIFVGHPDAPAFANEYLDKSPKGMIVDLEVRANGLFCKPVFTQEGSELVEKRAFRAFSAFWSAQEIENQGSSLKMYRPDTLKSAGLTNRPNLPVHLLNEIRPVSPAHPIMNKQMIIDFLSTQGITLANEATDTQIANALQQLGNRVAIAETTVAARSLQLETLNAELANERQFHIETLLDAALTSGCITAAQRPEWSQRLATDFTNESAVLERLTPTLKTHAVTFQFGSRKAEIANASERRDALDTLVRAEMTINGGDYDRAFVAVQKNNPALFSAMKQPSQ